MNLKGKIHPGNTEIHFMDLLLLPGCDLDGDFDFPIPSILTSTMSFWLPLCKAGISHDTAGYVTPQGLRNVLIISAIPYQWKHMIGQRCCRRNTDEMRIVMLKVWHELQLKNPVLFHPSRTGPFCQREHCQEGKMSCQHPISKNFTPAIILSEDYPLLFQEGSV